MGVTASRGATANNINVPVEELEILIMKVNPWEATDIPVKTIMKVDHQPSGDHTILGQPNSSMGTTQIEEVITSSHPAVHTGPVMHTTILLLEIVTVSDSVTIQDTAIPITIPLR